MKKHNILFILVSIVSLITIFALTACGTNDLSSHAYWFNDYEKTFVKYDDSKDNLEQAGTYWNMTAKKDYDNISFYLLVSTDNAHNSYTTLTINDKPVKLEFGSEPGVNLCITNLKLKKGDKISFHSKWVNSLLANKKGFEMYNFMIGFDGDKYIIEDMCDNAN